MGHIARGNTIRFARVVVVNAVPSAMPAGRIQPASGSSDAANAEAAETRISEAVHVVARVSMTLFVRNAAKRAGLFRIPAALTRLATASSTEMNAGEKWAVRVRRVPARFRRRARMVAMSLDSVPASIARSAPRAAAASRAPFQMHAKPRRQGIGSSEMGRAKAHSV